MTTDDTTDEHELVGLSAETVESLNHAVGPVADKAVKAEAKAAKQERKRQKKATKKAAKAAAKDARRAVESGQPAEFAGQQAEGPAPRMTPQRARNAINVARVVLPVAIPVLLPYAVRVATATREAYDRFQARRLGTDVESLGEYSGPGAALHIRIAGLSHALGRLDAKNAPAQDFAGSASATLRQLSAAVQAADTMPATRRRDAHRAVSAELDELEAQLLRHHGVR